MERRMGIEGKNKELDSREKWNIVAFTVRNTIIRN